MPEQSVEIASLLDEVRQFDWASWAIDVPERRIDYEPRLVPEAFERLASSTERDGYHAILNAIGHDHSGTPYPSMVPGSSFLVRMIPLLPMPQAAVAMEVMADVVGWTWNEAHFIDPDGKTCPFGLSVRQAAQLLLPLARTWIFEGDNSQRFAAVDLMEILADTYRLPSREGPVPGSEEAGSHPGLNRSSAIGVSERSEDGGWAWHGI